MTHEAWTSQVLGYRCVQKRGFDSLHPLHFLYLPSNQILAEFNGLKNPPSANAHC